jgi:hypothetical protein
MPPVLMERIKTAAERLGISVAEVIRMAAGIGLEHLRRIDYNIDSAICDAVESAQKKLPFYSANDSETARAAEPPTPYKTGGAK